MISKFTISPTTEESPVKDLGLEWVVYEIFEHGVKARGMFYTEQMGRLFLWALEQTATLKAIFEVTKTDGRR